MTIDHEWFLAASEGRTDDLRARIAQGAILDDRDGWNLTALANAARSGHGEMVQALIDLGADIDLENGWGWTATTQAARYHPELVPILEAAGGRVGLLEAVLMGDLDRARSLRDEFDGPAAEVSSLYAACLVTAVNDGRRDLVNLLLEHRPDRSSLDVIEDGMALAQYAFSHQDCVIEHFREWSGHVPHWWRWTGSVQKPSGWAETVALGIAALGPHRAIVDDLLAAGAEIGLLAAVALGDEVQVDRLIRDWVLRKGYLNELIEVMAERANPRILLRLIEEGVGRGTLPIKGKPWAYLDDWFKKASEGDAAALKEMIVRGANVDAINEDGWTALMLAIRGRHLQLARLLIDCGADPDRPGYRDGDTPMSLAVFYRNPEFMALIEAAGGRITLREAVALGDLERVRRLCDEGADPDGNAHWSFGNTFVMIAARNGDMAIVRELIDRGVSLAETDDLGQTPLIRAVDAGHAEIVGLLLDRGADVDQRDWFGLYPLDYAAVGEHRLIVGRLIEAGATRHLLDAVALGDASLVARLLREGANPNQDCACLAGHLPDFAAKLGNPEIIRLLADAGARPAPGGD